MDGPQRTNRVQVAVPRVVVAQAQALARARPAGGVRYVTGMDGIRRPVAMPTPSDILANMAVAPLAEAAGSAGAGPDGGEDGGKTAVKGIWPWRARPTIAFSLVAVALVAASATAITVNSSRATTASAEGETKMAATAPAADEAAAAAAAALNQRQAALQQLLDQFAAGQSGGHFNIVVKDLTTGATASVDPDKSYMSASLYKLFVANQIYRMVDTGQLTYGQAAGGGSGRNISGCLNAMITVSDNGCGRALGSLLNWGAQNSSLANAGYTGTSLATPQQTSARDVAMLFERLYNGTLNSPSSNEAFMTLLKSQRVNNRLPTGVPAGTVMAHKTGDLNNAVHDAGIIYGPKTNYLVVAMSGGWKQPGVAPAQFNVLSQQLWKFFQQ